MRLDGHEGAIDALRSSVDEQLLDDHLGHRVLAFTEMVEADPSLRVGDVERRPEMIGEGLPDPVIGVERDRIVDAEVARSRDHVVDVMLEAELGRVHADDRQPEIAVLGVPGAEVRRRPQPVDTGVGPEVDRDHATAESGRRQWLGVEPTGRAVEPRQVALDRQDIGVARRAVGDRAEHL